MNLIKMVVIGFGGMGSYHARDLIAAEAGAEVFGVYDIDPVKNKQAASEGFFVFDTLEAVLNHPEVEAVLIATPNDSHQELSLAALNAGKHVMCEKPAMMSSLELEEVLSVASEKELTFMVHQNRRWDDDFLIIRNLYQTREIGELFQIESRVHGANGIPGDWRHLKEHGGGMVLDWGVHLLDQMLFMVDCPLQSVMADLSYRLGDPVDDGFIAYLVFENGVRAIVEVGTSNFVKLPRWYVKGFEGTAVIKDWDLSGEIVKQTGHVAHNDLVPIQAGQGLTKTMAPPSEEATTCLPLPEAVADFDSIYANFAKCIREEAEPIVKSEEVMAVLRLIEAIFESAKTQQTIHF